MPRLRLHSTRVFTTYPIFCEASLLFTPQLSAHMQAFNIFHSCFQPGWIWLYFSWISHKRDSCCQSRALLTWAGTQVRKASKRMGSGIESPWSTSVWYNQYSDNIGLAWPISGFLTKKFGSEDSCSLSKAFLCSSCALHTLTCCFLLEGLQPFFPVEFLSVVHDLGKDEPLASFLSRKEAPKKRTG